MGSAERITFMGGTGDRLAARLDRPTGTIRAYAIVAHCFTCSKDLFAVQRIASELAARGIAVLRFDFTGLGASAGEFANTNFSSNVEDLRRAASYLAEHHRPAQILIGHSLGGAAVLAAAGSLPDIKAVVTIAAPADAEHVVASFKASLPIIESEGEAEVTLAGRPFTIQRQFLDDLHGQDIRAQIHNLRRPLLILHAPGDEVVGIDNAKQIFDAARHPKSFVSLDQADHLLTRREDALYVADLVSAWCGRYLLGGGEPITHAASEDVLVRSTGRGRFEQAIQAGPHRSIADEPAIFGGLGSGPSPYDLLSASLAACTSMTFRLYAERKGWQLPPFTVGVRHARVHAEDCTHCVEGRSGLIDQFDRVIRFEEKPNDEILAKALEIAGKCPVHRTLEATSRIVTGVES